MQAASDKYAPKEQRHSPVPMVGKALACLPKFELF